MMSVFKQIENKDFFFAFLFVCIAVAVADYLTIRIAVTVGMYNNNDAIPRYQAWMNISFNFVYLIYSRIIQVGNCVGKRNYRFFYMFIVSLAFLAVFIFSCSVTHLVLRKSRIKLFVFFFRLNQNSISSTIFININYNQFLVIVFLTRQSNWKWEKKQHHAVGKDSTDEFIEIVKKAPFSVVVTLICFFSIWSVIGLAGFHTYLTTSDQTTNEDVSTIKSDVQPFKKKSCN